jgi:hypothetical protein
MRSWITPIYSSFQNNDVENFYYICVKTSFLDMFKLEKTVRLKALIETRIFDFTDPSSIN